MNGRSSHALDIPNRSCMILRAKLTTIARSQVYRRERDDQNKKRTLDSHSTRTYNATMSNLHSLMKGQQVRIVARRTARVGTINLRELDDVFLHPAARLARGVPARLRRHIDRRSRSEVRRFAAISSAYRANSYGLLATQLESLPETFRERSVDSAKGTVREIKVHYRLAKFSGGDSEAQYSLQDLLTKVMQTELGKDSAARVLPMAPDTQHQGCLNFSDPNSKFFAAEILHLDGRTTLPRWIKSSEPKPVAEIVPHELPENEASLAEPVYLMVIGNHLAAIERMGFRNSNLSYYLNGLLKKAGLLSDGSEWKFVPKIEVSGATFATGGVKKVVVKPHAAVVGNAPSSLPDDGQRRKARRAASAFEGLAVFGERVLQALVAFGADEAKLEKLREAMSADLAIKAKLELSVANVRKKTTAEVSQDTISQALAELTDDGEVIIVSEGSRKNGKMTQLVETAEVLEEGGRIVWGRAVNAMMASLSSWAAKGAIILDE